MKKSMMKLLAGLVATFALNASAEVLVRGVTDPFALDLTPCITNAVEEPCEVRLEYSPLYSTVDADSVALHETHNGTTLVVVAATTNEGSRVRSVVDWGSVYTYQLVFYKNGIEVGERRTMNYIYLRFLTDPVISAALRNDTFVYNGLEHRPPVVIRDSTRAPDFSVSPYAVGDVNGDGLLSSDDVTKINRYVVYLSLPDDQKSRFSSYNLTGSALAAADVDGDGVVTTADATELQSILDGCYVLVEGRDYTVTYRDNVFPGTATATVVGIGTYGGELSLPFTIENKTIAGEPGDGPDPQPPAISKYDIDAVYDGTGHGFDLLQGLQIEGQAPVISYSFDGTEWTNGPLVFTNACSTSLWYRLELPYTTPYIHEVKVTVAAKSILDESIKKTLSQTWYDYDGTAKTPAVTIVDEGILCRRQVEAPFAPGDVDGDGMLTEADIDVLDKYVGYLALDESLRPFFDEFNLTGAAAVAADFNEDGVVDANDCDALEACLYSSPLVEGVDYSLEYLDNVEGHPAYALVVGIGNYAGTVDLPFDIGCQFPPLDINAYNGFYDGTAHSLSVSVSGMPAATVEYAYGDDGEYSTLAPSFIDAGTYVIRYRVSADGYTTKNGQSQVVINRLPIDQATVTLGSSFTYNGAQQTQTVTSVKVNGLDATFTVSGNVGTDAGDYTLTVTGVGNFTGTATKTWSIARKSIVGATVTLGSACTYNGVPQTQTVSSVAVDGLSATYTVNGNTQTNAGDYTLTVTGVGNFTGTVTKPWNLAKKDLAETEIVLGPALTYSGVEQTQTITSVKADGFDATYTVTGNTGVNAGTYQLALAGTGNYTGTVTKQWRIAKKQLTMIVNDASIMYGEAAANAGVRYEGFVNGEDESVLTGAVVYSYGDYSAGKPVGEYEFTARHRSETNYTFVYVNGKLTVTKRAITLTSSDKSKAYDGIALAVTAADVTAGGSGYAAGESFTLGGFAEITDAGTTEAAFTVADGTALKSNYEITTVFGDLKVTRCATEIVVTADSSSWTYDGAAHTKPTWTATGEGALTAGDELVVEFDAASAVTRVSEGEVANTISALRVMRGDRDVTANYWLTPMSGVIKVTPRPVAIVSASAEKVYDGEALVKHEYSVGGSGFVGDDGVTCEYTGTQTDVGESDNAFTYAFNEGTEAENYEISTENGKLKVVAFDIANTDDSDWEVTLGEELTYNGAEQSMPVTSAIYKGAPVTFTVSENTATNAGDYELKLTGTGNFTGAKNFAWPIARRSISLISPSKAKPYDGTPLSFRDDELTVGGDGYAPGEAFTITDKASLTNAGRLSATFMVRDGTAKLANYDIAMGNGELVVTKIAVPVVVTTGSESWTYDGAAHTNGTYTVENSNVIVEGEELVVAFADTAVVRRPDDGPQHDGVVPNAVAGVKIMHGDTEVTANYTVSVQTGELRVTKRPVTVTVKGTRGREAYNGAEQQVEGYTLATEDELYDVDTMVGFAGEAKAARTEPGTTKMELAVEQFSNNDVCFDVTFVVEDGEMQIYAADISDVDHGVFAAMAVEGEIYDGNIKTGALASVTYNGLPVTCELIENVATNAGDYVMKVVGTGAFTGTNTVAWTIRKRPITLTAKSKTKPHDGTPLAVEDGDITASGDGYAEGERFAYDTFASITAVGQLAATFAYHDSDTAKVSNYDVTVTEGPMLTVTKPELTVTKRGASPDGVTLEVGGAGDWTVHYTTDGTEPTAESPVYEGAIEFSCRGPQVVKVVAVSDQGELSAVVEFLVESPVVTVTPADGTIFVDSLDVELAADLEGAVIYYTLDGTEPTTNSTKYTGLRIEHRTTVKAMAVVEGWPWSETVTASYCKGQAPAPTITPGTGSVFSNTVAWVEISTAVEGAEIRYTLDGSEPNEDSELYVKPLKLADTTTVTAKVYHPDYDPSEAATSTITRVRWMGDALNAPDLQFAEGTGTDWTEDRTVSHDGVASMRSGAIEDGGMSAMKLTVQGSGRLLFWWKASCEEDPWMHDWDYVVFKVDRAEKARLDGETGWQLVEMRIDTAGTHTLQWIYRKDEMESAGEDCAWVDQITWIPDDGSAKTQLTDTPVPYEWLYEHGLLEDCTPEEAVARPTGKTDADGNPLTPEADYVAGTDPRVLDDRLLAYIAVTNNIPYVSWSPDLNEGGTKQVRVYRVWGKKKLSDEKWVEVNDMNKVEYNFFKVTVEMP